MLSKIQPKETTALFPDRIFQGPFYSHSIDCPRCNCKWFFFLGMSNLCLKIFAYLFLIRFPKNDILNAE